jgi:hypothetical protein
MIVRERGRVGGLAVLEHKREAEPRLLYHRRPPFGRWRARRR